jgi:hypothetical protein
MQLRQQQILVEFVGGAFPKKKKCVVEGNRVILRQAREGRGGAAITAEFDANCLVPYRSGLTRGLKYKLLLTEGADKCVSFARGLAEVPTCTKQDVSNYGNATVIKLAGSLKPPFNINLIYVLLIAGIILTVFSILVGSGRIHI